MAMTEAQARAIKKYEEKQERLGYAKYCRKMPTFFLREIEKFIKKKSVEWDNR